MKLEGLKRWLSALLCACMVAAMAPCAGAAEDETLQSKINALETAGIITLDKNYTEDLTIAAGKDVTLDLAGKTLTGRVISEGNVTIKDSTATAAPVVSDDYKTVTYSAGKIYYTGTRAAVQALNGGTIKLESGIVEPTRNLGLSAIGDLTGATELKSTITMTGGYAISPEGSATAQGKGAVLNISGGVVVTRDNAAVAGNGSSDANYHCGGTEINITGGTIIGRISTSGYIACGIYHPQQGTLNVSGGTIVALGNDDGRGGVGIEMRGGVLNLTGGTILANGHSSGQVGDSTVAADCYGVHVDGGSKYYDYANCKVTISGNAVVKAAEGVASAIVTPANDQDKISISDGTFSSDVTKYCVTGKMAKQGEDGLYSIVDIPAVDEGQIEKAVGEQQDNEFSTGAGVAEDDKAAAEEVVKNVNAALTEAAKTAASKENTADVVDTLLKSKRITLTDDKINEDVTLEVQPYLDVKTEVYNVNVADKQLKLEITPKYDVVAYTEQMGENASVIVSEGNVMTVNTPTEVTITLPQGFVTDENQKVYIKHEKNGRTYLYDGKLAPPVEGQSQYALFFTSEHGFSPFTVTTSLPLATVTKSGVTTAYDMLQDAADAASSSDEIVLNSGEKHTLKFTETKSVKVTNRTGAQITVTFNGEDKPIENTKSEMFSYTKPSSGGSGSGTTTYKVTVLSADNGNVNASPSNAAKGKTITITVTPDKGYELDTLTAADGSGKAVELTKKSDTTYTFTMPASSVKVSASFAKVKQSFDDVKTGDWFAKAVDYAADQGMMNGVGNNKFAPDAATTRGMIVTVLYRLENEPTVGSAAFTDVHDGEYYAKAVAWASANGIVNGYGNGKFGPNDAITREQFAAILYRYAQYKGYDVSVGESTNILSYADAQSISEYAIPALQWACGAGVMNGAGGKLLPKDNATRAQAAQLLMNFCENAVK